MTYDQMAIEILISDRTPTERAAALEKLARHAKGERTCPNCGTTDVHEDNGATRADELTWLCTRCGEQFDEVEG
jgi:transposase-like protein